jgi:hypothetical protein
MSGTSLPSPFATNQLSSNGILDDEPPSMKTEGVGDLQGNVDEA